MAPASFSGSLEARVRGVCGGNDGGGVRPSYRLGGEANRARDRRNLMAMAQSPARRDTGAGKKASDVTRASAVGADVWTPHVSDWKGKKRQRVPVYAGWADAGPLRAR